MTSQLNPSRALTRKQQRLVERNSGVIAAVVSASVAAAGECQHQFRNRRWNCPLASRRQIQHQNSSIYGNILKQGTNYVIFVKHGSGYLQNLEPSQTSQEILKINIRFATL